MALGSYGLGLGPLGFEPIDSSTVDTVTVPKATLFDLASRSFLVDDDGYTRAMDPVDQEVVLALGIERGAVKASPETGIDLERIRAAKRNQRDAITKDAVRVALSAPLARQDITLGAVSGSFIDGRLYLSVDYTNLRTGARRSARVSA